MMASIYGACRLWSSHKLILCLVMKHWVCQAGYRYVFTWDPGLHGRECFRQVKHLCRYLFFGATKVGAYKVTILMSSNDSVCQCFWFAPPVKIRQWWIIQCISYIIARRQITGWPMVCAYTSAPLTNMVSSTGMLVTGVQSVAMIQCPKIHLSFHPLYVFCPECPWYSYPPPPRPEILTSSGLSLGHQWPDYFPPSFSDIHCIETCLSMW